MAWSVAMQHDAAPELIEEAVALARAGTGRSPKTGMYFNTLGVVLVRAAQWDEAVSVLRKACELRSGGDAYDWYPLAIALKHQGQREEAQNWFDRAEQWRRDHPLDDSDLNQLRDAATAAIRP